MTQWAEIEADVVARLRDCVLSMPEWLLRTRGGGFGCDYGIGILLDREEVECGAFRSVGRLPPVWLTAVRPRLTLASFDADPIAPSFREQQWHAMTPNAWISFAASYILPPRHVKTDSTGMWTVGFAFYEQGD